MDLLARLYLAAHDEWEISTESRELARDALAEIERLNDVVQQLRRTVDAGSLAAALVLLAPLTGTMAVRAYNDWVHDYCATDRSRLFPSAVLPLQSVEASIACSACAWASSGAPPARSS